LLVNAIHIKCHDSHKLDRKTKLLSQEQVPSLVSTELLFQKALFLFWRAWLTSGLPTTIRESLVGKLNVPSSEHYLYLAELC